MKNKHHLSTVTKAFLAALMLGLLAGCVYTPYTGYSTSTPQYYYRSCSPYSYGNCYYSSQYYYYSSGYPYYYYPY